MVTCIPAFSFQREMVYSSRDSSPTRRLNTLPSSTASASSGSPSRSRLSYSGGRPPSFAGSHPQHEQPRHPHHPSAGHGANAGLSPSPSAILERRDVKPDEEVSAKNMALMKNEGLYADPYSLMHEGRLSIASTQSLAAIGDPFNFPVSTGLYRRGSVRSLSTYSAAALQGDLEDSLYKPGGSLYSDTYSSATLGMGFRMPPSSPQKIPDMQLRDRDSYSSSPSRASPVRQTFRKDSASSVFVESPKSRPSSSSEPLCLTAGPGEGGRATPGFGSSMTGPDPDSSRSVWVCVMRFIKVPCCPVVLFTQFPGNLKYSLNPLLAVSDEHWNAIKVVILPEISIVVFCCVGNRQYCILTTNLNVTSDRWIKSDPTTTIQSR